MAQVAGGGELAVGWELAVVAGERALDRRAGGCRFLFGLGPPTGGRDPARRARAVLAGLAGDLAAVRWCRQVHGATVVAVGGGSGAACAGPGDALVTDRAGVGLLVWGADCGTVLIGGDGVAAAVHAGWRGAAATVVSRTVAEIGRRFGVLPERLQAALGPAVGPCHYPVGDEVIAALAATGLEEACWRSGDRVDLRGFLRAELERAGVRRVATVGACTACSPELASYRRDGARAGRQMALVAVCRGASPVG